MAERRGDGAAASRVGFGGLLRAYRERRLLSQERLAERSGLSVRAIRDLELGRVRRPWGESVRLLVDALRLAGWEREQFEAAASGSPLTGPPRDQPLASAAGDERDVLVATKLHVPRPRPGFLARPRLLERLAAGMGRELVVVCTPAGFGKTTLLADWARQSRRPVAWLSLDDGDNDPARFWRHVAVALEEARPGVGQRVAALLGPTPPRSFDGLVAALVNELAGVAAEEVVLVLDDYHLVAGQP
jgi:transcriptional regulator with XRE-family HTH domain